MDSQTGRIQEFENETALRGEQDRRKAEGAPELIELQGLPSANCRKCHGRGFVGRDTVSGRVIPCSCVQRIDSIVVTGCDLVAAVVDAEGAREGLRQKWKQNARQVHFRPCMHDPLCGCSEEQSGAFMEAEPELAQWVFEAITAATPTPVRAGLA